jgi:hypothetical protein
MEKTEGRQAKATKRKSPAREKQEGGGARNLTTDQEEVTALKEHISRLEAENKELREQILAIGNSAVRPVQSQVDSVREQRHNFFKYSNVRRY